jgi:hypothetical protein
MKARSRTIKPEFFQNEELARLKPHTRLLFAGLWILADREGRLENNPSVIKGFLFPHEPKLDVCKMLQELQDTAHICNYSVNDKNYLFIPTFTKHQSIHPHEAESVIPPCEEINKDVIKCNDITLQTIPCQKVEVEVEVEVKVEVKDIIDLFNLRCPFARKVQGLSDVRLGHIKSAIKRHPKIEWWRSILERVAKSPFLRGEIPPSNNHRQFKLEIDWLIKEQNLLWISEGKYDEQSAPNKPLSFADKAMRNAQQGSPTSGGQTTPGNETTA